MSLLSAARTVGKNLWESRLWPARPESINFEITAACDAKCIHCPRLDMDRPMKAMPMDIFMRMVDQAADLRVTQLCPNGYGEICTLPMRMLEPYFRHISSKAWPFKIIINTNGYRMGDERAQLFIDHRVHLVNVTIDGATAETAETIRVGLKFADIEANIKNLLRRRDAAGKRFPKVRVGMVALPQTLREGQAFLDRWRGIADFVGIGGYSTRLGSISLFEPSDASPALPAASACVLPFSDLNIWADGKAVLCCEDWNEEYVVGDLASETIAEIWHGPRMAAVRAKHLAGRGQDIALCAKCNNWRQPSVGARMWNSS
jgi:iron-sulfur cluster protein/radical SAM family protein